MTPLVSVVLPIYNVEKYLKRCLDSLAEQSLSPGDWELIAVNDGSTDGSLDIVHGAIPRFTRILIVSQENRGLAAARNRGLAMAKGTYVVFVDSDDYLAPDYLQRLIETMETTRADMAIADARIDRGGTMADYLDNRVWTYLKREGVSATNLALHPKILLFQPSVWRRIYRTEFLKSRCLTFPEELIFEDVPFHFQTMAWAEWIGFCPEPLYYYNDVRGESITNGEKKRFADMIAVFRKAHEIMTVDYDKSWLLFCYLFEFRMLKWARTSLGKERRTLLQFYPPSVRLLGWFARLKQKYLNRI